MPSENLDWHRFFGLILTDFFTNLPFVVELEKDLSLKKQLLDVTIIRKEEGTFSERLPDGLDNLAPHNLVTFKSYQETLDAWALKELAGHGVNYRKQVSPSMQDLLPEEHFRLYAVCVRFPQKLAQQVELQLIQPGVYECRWGTDVIRILVLRQLPQSEHNAPLHLLCTSDELFRFGAGHYRMHSKETSTLLKRLYDRYLLEEVNMSYTMEDFRREHGLTLEERLEGLSPEERLKGLPPEERLKGLPAEERLKGLSPEERLKGLSPKDRASLLQLLSSQDQPPPTK